MNHVHLGTLNLEKSVSFYQKHFGFKIKFNHPPGVFLENDAGFLMAIDPVQSIPEFPNWFHLGFCLKTEAEVLSCYNQLKESGVKIARELMDEKNEFASFYIFDPDGYRIEVSWHNE